MSSIKEIRKIEDVLHLNTTEKIVNHKMTDLTTPGENYCSAIYKVDVTIKTSEETKTMYLVAKMLSPDSRIRELFNSEQQFLKEVEFYKTILPLLDKFQKQFGIEDLTDIFPEYYGSRLNCDNSKFDPDAVLLLENLQTVNYKILDRSEGFDLKVARLGITALAQFHAIFVSLKLQKKYIFEREIKPHLLARKMDEDFHNNSKKRIDDLIRNIPELVLLRKRILAGFDKKLVPTEPREPFATVIHNDLWVNNVMVKYEGGEPVKIKIIDLQEYTYASPAKDVLFFLFSSVKITVLEKHYEDLIDLYHETFVSILQKFKCDLIPFTLENLKEELSFEAKHSQFGHILFMLFAMFATQTTRSVDDLLKMEPSDLHKKKLIFIVQEFARRNWI